MCLGWNLYMWNNFQITSHNERTPCYAVLLRANSLRTDVTYDRLTNAAILWQLLQFLHWRWTWITWCILLPNTTLIGLYRFVFEYIHSEHVERHAIDIRRFYRIYRITVGLIAFPRICCRTLLKTENATAFLPLRPWLSRLHWVLFAECDLNSPLFQCSDHSKRSEDGRRSI